MNFTKISDWKRVDRTDPILANARHAVFCAFYVLDYKPIEIEAEFTDPQDPSKTIHQRIVGDTSFPLIPLQMRFDGKLGFPGGLMDHAEMELAALEREALEELHFKGFRVDAVEYVCSHYCAGSNLVTHLFSHKITEQEFIDIEKNYTLAHHFGNEVLGVVRVPQFNSWFEKERNCPGQSLLNFLQHNFAGCGRDQLLCFIRKYNFMPKEHLDRIEAELAKLQLN